MFLHGISTNSRGVAILFKDTMQYDILDVIRDDDGNMLTLQMNCASKNILLINAYGPNIDNPTFFQTVKRQINTIDHDYFILCGDLNVTLNPQIDTFNYVGQNNSKSRDSLLDVMNSSSLIDIYRHLNPESQCYTLRRKNPIKQARLDYFIVSQTLLDIVTKVDIKTGYRTDHSLITLSICFTNFTRGPGVWRFNTSLLKDKEYLSLVKTWINDEKLKYAVPIYNFENIHTIPDESLCLNIDFDLFLEMLLLRIRGETIKYSSYKKRQKKQIEKDLILEIESLEKNLTNNNQVIYDEKKTTTSNNQRKCNEGQLYTFKSSMVK